MLISMPIKFLVECLRFCVVVNYIVCAFILIIAFIIIANLDERLPAHAEMLEYAVSNFYKWYIPVWDIIAGITLTLKAYKAWKERDKYI